MYYFHHQYPNENEFAFDDGAESFLGSFLQLENKFNSFLAYLDSDYGISN